MQPINLKMYVLAICLVLMGSAFLAGCTQEGPEPGVVKTDAGSVSGMQQGNLRVFTGIPFAAPPTGDLRWRPPAPVQPWEGVKETKVFSPACPQPLAADPTLNMSEDCLYLNVWTPATSADEKLPVMVFIYGGAFGKIAGSMPLYNGTALAEKGVVVVTTNYRVGALGFLAHPELDSESSNNVSGNYGLLDQIAAMQWVRKNIGEFGGDPSRVTIFGQSAGGESILIHLVSPQSKGLFMQAIVESGTFWTNGAEIDALNSRADAEQLGQTYAQGLGYSGPGTIAQMRKLPYQELTNATPWPAAPFQMVNMRHFEPTIDGWLIPGSPDELFRLHRQNPVPLIIGSNADDGRTLAAGANMTVPEYQAFIRARFGNDADAVLVKYPARTTADVQLRLEQIMTDYDFTNAVKFVAGSNSDLNQSTYRYQYTYVLPGANLGAFHGSETILLFRVPLPPDQANEMVSDNLVDLWTRFAKTGNPNGGMNATWPAYTRDAGQYLDINETMTVKASDGTATPAASGDWKFVVFADSPDPAGNTTTGVSPALIPIA
ncbi:MAG: carboxylesterase family protein [Methanoregula sp.]|jgi:para-nitrobenzyl esterase